MWARRFLRRARYEWNHMRVAQIAPLYESVPPHLYGGTERIVSYLTEALVRRGHDVTLFASADSETRARLVPGCPRALRSDSTVLDPLTYHVAQLRHVMDHARRFDIIHNHMDYLGFPLVGADWRATVHHGLPVDNFTFGRGDGGYLAFLGRISPEKGVDSAIRIAAAVGIPLKIAAKIDRADAEYYEEVIRPLLGAADVEFLGEIGSADKVQFLGAARALLFPIDWPEPFGLVTIEALACGTPVVARRRGSVSEVLDHGVTGFVCDGDAEMIEAVRRIDEIDRRRCRRVFESRFSETRMVDDYERIYAETIGRLTARSA